MRNFYPNPVTDPLFLNLSNNGIIEERAFRNLFEEGQNQSEFVNIDVFKELLFSLRIAIKCELAKNGEQRVLKRPVRLGRINPEIDVGIRVPMLIIPALIKLPTQPMIYGHYIPKEVVDPQISPKCHKALEHWRIYAIN